MAEPAVKKARVTPTSKGPCIWWARNDLRVHDNPVMRLVVGAALQDDRPFAAVFCFDPRFLDKSPYGRVTDPDFKLSIASRKAINFSSRKTNALRARFWLECVKKLGEELAVRGSKLIVCHGKPEDVFGALPEGSEVKCMLEPVSIEQTDVEGFVREALAKGGSKLRTDPGAMSLYHPDDMPFVPRDGPESYSELGSKLGWKNIWGSAEREEWASTIRKPTPCPKVLPRPPNDLQLPGQIPSEVLADETQTLRRLGYTEEEIKEAQEQTIPKGGEPAARLWLDQWVEEMNKQKQDDPDMSTKVYWDLPCGGARRPGEGVDPMQWVNLTTTTGGMRISHYMAVGCVTAREIFARSHETPFAPMVAHRLMWREFHRLYAMKYHRKIAWLQGPAKVQRTWSQDPDIALAWKQGKTGVPYIDACQRELQKTGWLAYKGRKTSAWFLVFDLWMDWRIGAYHDEETLLDYDFAMNYGNWAVVSKIGNGGATAWAGSREFDSEHWDLKYKLRAEQENDPSGAYIRRWVPELQNVPDKHIHTPWFMSPEEMQACGCVLGKDYPASLVGALEIAACHLNDEQKNDEPVDVKRSEQYLETAIEWHKTQLEAKARQLEELRAGKA